MVQDQEVAGHGRFGIGASKMAALINLDPSILGPLRRWQVVSEIATSPGTSVGLFQQQWQTVGFFQQS